MDPTLVNSVIEDVFVDAMEAKLSVALMQDALMRDIFAMNVQLLVLCPLEPMISR